MNALKDSKNEVLVCIPTFNSQDDVVETLKSVLNQSYKNFDVVVVDNCSTDGTLNSIQKFSQKDSRVHFIQNKKNLGRIENWNECVELFKQTPHKYFKFVFVGDTLEEDCLKRFVSIFKKNISLGLVASGYYVHDKKVKIKASFGKTMFFSPLDALQFFFKRGNWVGGPLSCMFSKDALQSNQFLGGLEWVADWKFYVNITREFDSFYTPEPLGHFYTSKRKHHTKHIESSVARAEEIYMKHYILESIGDIDIGIANDLKKDFNKEEGKHIFLLLSPFEIVWLILYKLAKQIKKIFT